MIAFDPNLGNVRINSTSPVGPTYNIAARGA